ncbi:MAG: hypothetical protein NTY07_10985 [Bacteroidia bacterium]|nr:hypothetical protein [Bacteroidia bacterium]
MKETRKRNRTLFSGSLTNAFLKLNFDNPSNRCDAPDYILTKKDIPVGFIEAKSKALALYV